MPSVFREGQRPRPDHGRQRQLAIEMREQCAAPRGLPTQLRAECVGVDRDEHEVVPAREPFLRGLGRLSGGGEMDVAVGAIDGGAVENAAGLAARHSIELTILKMRFIDDDVYSCNMRLSSSSSSRRAESAERRPSILRTACSTVV